MSGVNVVMFQWPKETYMGIILFFIYDQEKEASSTESIAEHIKRLSIDDTYVFGSSEATSGDSSLSGEVVVNFNEPLKLLNSFLEECNVKRIDTPQLQWDKCAERTQRNYIQNTRDILVVVLKVASPENAGYLWTALQGSMAVGVMLGVEGILLHARCGTNTTSITACLS